ncbi:hypothetical protein EG68_10964 [Paragonimus skrjabini miyazakii]|uniref:Protein regulator of cytokinesis 1 n=1 Tax=Paragonimus skrjabini miyazakii TaxID=59628 RepID=A0A8S9YIS6_9TREM|nr:hypothetical protein EG68_10964 [Paragonimus skrjabini miyazakii]
MDCTAGVELKVLNALRPRLTELVSIWEYVGYNEEERADHLSQATQKLRCTLEDIIAQENAARLDMEQLIERKRREVAELCQQLRIPSYLPDRSLSSNDLLKVLQQKSEELFELKSARCTEYTRLRERVLRLSELLQDSTNVDLKRMAEFPELSHSIRGANGDQENSVLSVCIPTEQQIRDLLAVHEQLNAIYAPLAAQYISLREDITRIARDIAYEPQSDQELEILKAVGLVDSQASSAAASTPGVVRRLSETTRPLVNGSVSTKSDVSTSSVPTPDFLEPPVNQETLKWLTDWRFKLVKEKARLVGMCEELRAYLTTMWLRLDKPVAEQAQFLNKYSGYKPDTLEALQEEVDRCQQLKWEKLDTYLDRLNAEATKLARLCCMDEKIVELPTNQDSTDPEVVANHLETVLEHLNQTYSLYKPIFESIGVYEELWQALSEVELRLKDPAIFSNRGGILLKTEKEKKRLTKELQRAEQDTLTVIEQYELKTKSVFKLSNGQTFKDYIADRSSGGKQHARDLSRVRRSVVSTNSRPASTHTSAPPGAPT